MRLSIYALGGGLGHVTRALAFSRAAVTAGHEVRILVNSADAESLLSHARNDSCSDLAIAAQAVTLLSPQLTPGQSREHVLAWLDDDWDALLVDTFPRGLGGELADFVPRESRPVFLVHRDLSERYVTSRDIRSFASAFERILLPGESGPLSDLPKTVPTGPWLICDPKDLLDRVSARIALRATEADSPLVLVVGSGRANEVADSVAIASRLRDELGEAAHVRFASLDNAPTELADVSVSLWPLMRYMRGIDFLVGAGGYNTVHEARATNTRLLATPRPRLYDRQDRRLESNELSPSAASLVSTVIGAVASHTQQGNLQPTSEFDNGVHTAIREIESALR